MRAPFPYFGGKSKIADLVWSRFGDTPNYVEPFVGSAAMLLNRPGWSPSTLRIETINDASGYVSNFWRALQHDPDSVAHYADQPVFENDLHARHSWLIQQDIVSRLEGDPDFHDPKIAGWWVWGMCCWIGGGFCSGRGGWQSVDGQLVYTGNAGIKKRMPHLSSAGMGVNRKRMHSNVLHDWMHELAERLRHVRVCCGDWSRVCRPTPTYKNGLTAVFLDPPYADTAGRAADLYEKDCLSVAHDVRNWAIKNGDNPLMRIALCGYDGEHEMPDTWERVAWKTQGGYGAQSSVHDNPNAAKERVWFSPHCLQPMPSLFDMLEVTA